MGWHQKDIDEILKELSSYRSGLSESEADERLQRYGPNIPREKKKKSAFTMLLDQFKDFMILVLFRESSEFIAPNAHIVAFGFHFNRESDQAFNLCAGSIIPNGGLQIYLGLREETGPQLAVGGKTEPVAFGLKWS